MDGFSLRPATPDDLPGLFEIESRVHVAPWTLEHLQAELEKPYSQVLLLSDDETDEKIIGYVVYWTMLDDCQILNVVVDLPYRGLGHAQTMVREACKQAIKKGIKSANLEVRKTNIPAIQLYQKLGFSISAIRKGFYSNGEDAYFMTLPLEANGLEF